MSQTKIYSVHSENALIKKIDNLVAAICAAKKLEKMCPGQYGEFEIEQGEEDNFITLASAEGLGVAVVKV